MKFEKPTLPQFSLNADDKKVLVSVTNYLREVEIDTLQDLSEVLNIDADTLEVLVNFIYALESYAIYP